MPRRSSTIADRQFRRKGTGGVIAVAFHLSVDPIDEQRHVQGTFTDGHENFGWLVTYRATTPWAAPRSAMGPGVRHREGRPLPVSASAPDARGQDCSTIRRELPRLRSGARLAHVAGAGLRALHSQPRAHPRLSRAVSNWSALRRPRRTKSRTTRRVTPPARPRTRRTQRATPATIDGAQHRSGLFERWREAGGVDEAALRSWFAAQGVTDTSRIRCADYDDLVGQLLLDWPGVVAARARRARSPYPPRALDPSARGRRTHGAAMTRPMRRDPTPAPRRPGARTNAEIRAAWQECWDKVWWRRHRELDQPTAGREAAARLEGPLRPRHVAGRDGGTRRVRRAARSDVCTRVGAGRGVGRTQGYLDASAPDSIVPRQVPPRRRRSVRSPGEDAFGVSRRIAAPRGGPSTVTGDAIAQERAAIVSEGGALNFAGIRKEPDSGPQPPAQRFKAGGWSKAVEGR